MTPRAAITILAALALTLGGARAAPHLALPDDPAFDRSVTLVARGNLTLEEGFALLADAIGYAVFTRDVPDVMLTYDFETPRPARQVFDLLLRLYDLGAYAADDALIIAPPEKLGSFIGAPDDTTADAAADDPPGEPDAFDLYTHEYTVLDPDVAIEALSLLYPEVAARYLEPLEAIFVTATWFEHDEIAHVLDTLNARLAEQRSLRQQGFTSELYELPETVDGFERLMHDLDPAIEATVLDEIGLVRITMPLAAREQVEQILDRLTDMRRAKAPTRVTYNIDNATAPTLQAQLQTALEARDLPVTLIGDARTNTLTAIATTEAHAIIEELLHDLDQREQQVRVRVRIHEISKTEARRLGIDLSGRIGAFSASVGGQGLSLAFNPGGVLSPLTINGMLDALEQQSLARSIDDANLLTLNNQVAILNSGGSIRLLATEDSEGQEIQFGTLVRIQPRISSDGYITIGLDVELSGFEDEVAGGLRFTEQRVTNTVQVPDGGVVILGGLIRQGLSITEAGVPVLRDIPIIGGLFRTSSDTREESELIMTLEVNIETPQQPHTVLLERSAP